MTKVNCAYCSDLLGETCVDGDYCSERCRGLAEHERKLRENEVMTVRVHALDDGGHSVQIALRSPTGFREMARNYEDSLAAIRGIADLCNKVADDMEDAAK